MLVRNGSAVATTTRVMALFRMTASSPLKRNSAYGPANSKTKETGELSFMRRIGGRCQRGVRRCLWVNGEATTAQILEWAYPRGPGRDRRQRMDRARAVRHAAGQIAVKVGRVWPGGNVWRLKG